MALTPVFFSGLCTCLKTLWWVPTKDAAIAACVSVHQSKPSNAHTLDLLND